MHPCSFNEYLTALGEHQLNELFQTMPFPLYAHEKALSLFKTYMIIGGMPEALSIYTETKDIVRVNNVYESLITSFLDDVEKYAANGFVRVVRHLIRTAFAEAGKRIKFQGFGNSLYSSRDVHESFDLLEKAMLIKLIYPSTSAEMPIIGDLKKFPKLQLLDSGILHYQAGLQSQIFTSEDIESIARGKLIEHTVGLMIYGGFLNPSQGLNFWVREKKQSNAEVDYLVPYNSLAIPVEVKSGASGRLRSLHQFIDAASHDIAVRFSSSPFSVENARTVSGKNFRLMNLPWYLAGHLNRYIEWFAR